MSGTIEIGAPESITARLKRIEAKIDALGLNGTADPEIAMSADHVDPYKKMAPFELYGLMSKFIQDHRSDPLAEQMKPAWGVLRQSISMNPQSRSEKMTRDDAKLVLATKFQFFGSSVGFADDWVDTFVELGMLKLDEPSPIGDAKLENQFKRDGFLRRTEAAYVFSVLDELNLKIVEK